MNEESRWFIEPDPDFEDFHQNANIDVAQDLMDEAGYDGDPIRIIASNENDDQYSKAVVLQDQLLDAGMEVELIVVDWATATELNRQPESYEIFITTMASWPLLPPTFLFYNQDWPGFTDSEEIWEAGEALIYAEFDEEATAAMEQLQASHDDYMPIM